MIQSILSPGRWHEKVPQDLIENLAYRRATLERAADPNVQRGLIAACAEDLFFYAGTFVWQFNPDNIGHEVEPFIPFPFQIDAVRLTLRRLFHERRQCVWEKSRKLGATWWALIIFDWVSRFHRRKKFLAISHSEQAVDRPGDSDTLFWKLDFINEHLPDWLKMGANKAKLLMEYPETKSSVNGAATTERSGVGGRATALLLDEFAKHRQDREILGQTVDTGPCLIVSTHYGLDSSFHGLTQLASTYKIIWHWSQHPERRRGLYRSGGPGGYEILDKTYLFPPDFQFDVSGEPLGGPFPGIRSPWYDEDCVGRSKKDIAMHLDINPSGSMSQTWNPLLIRDLIRKHCRPPLWEGRVKYDPDTGEPADREPLERVAGGLLKLWVRPKPNGKPVAGRYGLAADLSHGTGATPSCLSIGELETGRRIGEVVTPRMDPKAFATLCMAIGQLFADSDGVPALLIWELQGPGITFRNTIQELGYANSWLRVRTDKLSKVVTEHVGWVPTTDSKNNLLSEYRLAVEAGKFLNYSEDALKETLKFRFDKSGNEDHSESSSPDDPSGARVNHGDRVIADGLLWLLMRDTAERTDEPIVEAESAFSLAGRRQLRHSRERAMASGWTRNGVPAW